MKRRVPFVGLCIFWLGVHSVDRAGTAKAIVTNRLNGARAGNRKLVDTRWKRG